MTINRPTINRKNKSTVEQAKAHLRKASVKPTEDSHKGANPVTTKPVVKGKPLGKIMGKSLGKSVKPVNKPVGGVQLPSFTGKPALKPVVKTVKSATTQPNGADNELEAKLKKQREKSETK